jgi:DNA-binding beta-propeller fold protein YncE
MVALKPTRRVSGLGLALAASFVASTPGSAQPVGDYVAVDDWATLPAGRSWGAVTGVYPDPDGQHLWVLDRCGANSCLGSDLDPVLKFDLDGRLVGSFGAGLFAWPHGFFVDGDGYVWVADGPTGALAQEAARQRKGQQVFKLDPGGEVLMTLGITGVTGGPDDRDRFNAPADVIVAPDGEIYVLDGHGAGGNNRVVRFDAAGRYLSEWGTSGPGPAAGEMSDPHAIAMDSRGRIFVGDRRNIRIQIFDRAGSFLEQWTHFGPPSNIFIDASDVIYVTDTQTTALPGWYGERRPDGWVRGIRIGDAGTGRVTAFIPSEAEFVAADRIGNVYGAHVPGETLIKYSRSP